MKVSDYARLLELSGISNSGQESVWLMSFALGVNTSQVLARSEFSHADLAKIDSVITRRENGEPLQYITGEADFYARDFYVGPGVLIPRHDTETLIQAVMRHIPRDETFTFIDWGTGSGCIAITLLLEYPNSFAYMLEASPKAADFARKNLQRYGLTDRAEILAEPESLPACELLISNPPYIPSGEIAGLARDVRDFEPHSALDGGSDGMTFYREIFSLAHEKQCRYIVLETGSINQVESLKTLTSEFTFCDEVLDGGNFPRCLVFRRSDVLEEDEAADC